MGCRIPFMDPFHPQIMKFITSTSDPICPGKRYGELVDGVLRFTGKIVIIELLK